MKNAKILVVLIIFISSGPVFAEKSKNQRMSEAAGVVSTMKFFIGRAAKDCKSIMGESDEYMHSIVNDWLERNGKYTKSAENWIRIFATAVAEKKGFEEGQSLANWFMIEAQENGIEKVKSVIRGSVEEEIDNCAKYKVDVGNGVYDINESTKYYGRSGSSC